MVTRYQRIPDSGHPTTELFAEQLYVRTPVEDWPPPFTGRTITWELEEPEMREAFRERARRFMAGDLSVLPWTWPIGYLPTLPACPAPR